MGITGLLPHLGPAPRISLAALSSTHYTTYHRPFRLAIDISIWLFQIQSGKGGSNPALRTFYYRLLRLLSLNIHPLFVFDGPNKPLFKRNKRVGGPGVKVATVPEFLAKQLLKQFGFPWHVAPGEAEAECALLQREGVVDAVLSEDVDTLMFGSGVTLRNWNSTVEGGGKGNKAPTHVSVYRAAETRERSGGIQREGMILVALMSGGDYIPEGVPGVGAKVACDAARAGFGKELCALHRKDSAGLKAWKEKLELEIRTNASKFFSRKNTGFAMPEEFPSREVLGYYTHPCVSTKEKVEKLRREVRWDAPIDFQALREFAKDAFDWRCRGGAKKFIKNLAPALLVRELRLRGEVESMGGDDLELKEAKEREIVHAIHGKRNHVSADGELEYRISFTPANLVPIDLSLEEEDDEFTPAGGMDDDSDAESEILPTSTQAAPDDTESDAPASPRKRQFRPYFPDQPEKVWILRPFLHVGCPLIVEDYEAAKEDPKEFLKQRRLARAAQKKDANIHAASKPARKKKAVEKAPVQENALTAYARITKTGTHDQGNERTMKELSPRANSRSNAAPTATSNITTGMSDEEFAAVAAFKLPSTQIPADLLRKRDAVAEEGREVEALDLSMSSPAAPAPSKASKFPAGVDPLRPFAAFASTRPPPSTAPTQRPSQKAVPGAAKTSQRTPKKTSRKRPPADLSSPALSQRSILSYYSPSPRKQIRSLPLATQNAGVVDLVSSSPAPLPEFDEDAERPLTPTPQARRSERRSASPTPRPRAPTIDSLQELPGTVTKRRRKGPLRRSRTEPVGGCVDDGDHDFVSELLESGSIPSEAQQPDTTILISSSPARSDDDLASPSTFVARRSQRPSQTDAVDDVPDFAGEGGFIREDAGNEDNELANDLDELPTYPTPPTTANSRANEAPTFQQPQPQPQPRPSQPKPKTKPRRQAKPKSQNHHPALGTVKKTRITLRESLEGHWKETEVDIVTNGSTLDGGTFGREGLEMLDVTENGSGWEKSGGRAQIWSRGWRKSGVEVLDLTGA